MVDYGPAGDVWREVCETGVASPVFVEEEGDNEERDDFGIADLNALDLHVRFEFELAGSLGVGLRSVRGVGAKIVLWAEVWGSDADLGATTGGSARRSQAQVLWVLVRYRGSVNKYLAGISTY